MQNPQDPQETKTTLSSLLLQEVSARIQTLLDTHHPALSLQELGSVERVTNGVATVNGLPNVKLGELLRFAGGQLGLAFQLDVEEVGVVMLHEPTPLQAGTAVRRTGTTLDTPVGDALIGRVLDGIGRPLDEQGPIHTLERRPFEREAPPIMHRAPVTVPLQTGLKVIDALFAIGRGQRELILGDRQTGKTTIALDTILNQHDTDVLCIYCAIGQRSSSVAKLIATLRQHDAMRYSIVIVAPGEASAGLQFVTPYVATSIAEHFMEQGRDVLIVYDDLTHHARAYRELSLLLRRPPAREAFPGDIFYIHSRLLERATHLHPSHGGGSLTALPIVETEAQNLSAYIPTNLISITDGQIYLSPELFQKGLMPAVEIGRSVSRVGGKTQLPAYRAVAGSLRLTYSQFEEVEAFARFGTRLDEHTRTLLQRGQRIREIFKQPQHHTMRAGAQVVSLLCASQGIFDTVPIPEVPAAEANINALVLQHHPELLFQIEKGARLQPEERQRILQTATQALQPTHGSSIDDNSLVSVFSENVQVSASRENAQTVASSETSQVSASSENAQTAASSESAQASASSETSQVLASGDEVDGSVSGDVPELHASGGADDDPRTSISDAPPTSTPDDDVS